MAAVKISSGLVKKLSEQGSIKHFTLFAGNVQQVREVLFAKTLLIHMDSHIARTIYIEYDRSYTEIRNLVSKAMRMDHCHIIFEMINDLRYLPFIQALLSRNFTIWAGIEANSSEDALNNLRNLAQPGWNPVTGLFTSTQTSRMASVVMRNIDEIIDGIEVVELQTAVASRGQAQDFSKMVSVQSSACA